MRGVSLGSTTDAPKLTELYDRARSAVGSLEKALALAETVAPRAPHPGSGETLQLWECLATLAAADLTVARVAEPHLDALAILSQAGVPEVEGTWGVFAAEGAGTRLEAEYDGGTWLVSGRKPWCSLGGRLDRAIVTASVPTGARRAFAVDLRHNGVRPIPGTWVSRGLAAVDSGPVDFERVPVQSVGSDNWYLERPGFAWGGIGVAACWYGGAVGVARRLMQSNRARDPDQIGLMHLGSVDVALHRMRAVLADAARLVDDGSASGSEGAMLAARVRTVVADGVSEILAASGHAMGPAPLVHDEDHARRVADLQVYVRQHHAERDVASLGASVLERDPAPW